MKIMTTLVVVLLWSATTAALPAGSAPQTRHSAIEALAQSVVASRTPGLAVLVVNGGEVLHRGAYGVRSLDGGQAVTDHTPFYIASMAKMITATGVLMLVQEERVGLDDPLGEYLINLPEYLHGISVAQLLNHTAGVPDYYEMGGEDRVYSNKLVLELLSENDRLAFMPGSRARYSNSGYVLLAELIEAVTGTTYSNFVAERILEPLGMSHTHVIDGAGALPQDRAIGYQRTEDGFEVSDYESSTVGPGGIYSCLTDLERWHLALRDGHLLQPEMLQLASRPPVLPEGRRTPYGMGWLAEFAARGPLKDKWYVMAFGSLRGFRALSQWYQDDDLLLIWLANSDDDAILEEFHAVPEMFLAQ